MSDESYGGDDPRARIALDYRGVRDPVNGELRAPPALRALLSPLQIALDPPARSRFRGCRQAPADL
jgi:hypothetical protein